MVLWVDAGKVLCGKIQYKGWCSASQDTVFIDMNIISDCVRNIQRMGKEERSVMVEG